jgi:hypothetical protein
MNQKNILIIIGVLIVIGLGIFYLYQKPLLNNIPNYKNISYQIEGQNITLKNGIAEVEIAPGSASKSITKYFGNEISADFNQDGSKDIAFLITQDNGGSGTFYYIVAALKYGDKYIGTNAILLGDRIAPQTTEFEAGEIIVNYADRKANEPMTTQPSVGVSRYFIVNGDKLVEIIN